VISSIFLIIGGIYKTCEVLDYILNSHSTIIGNTYDYNVIYHINIVLLLIMTIWLAMTAFSPKNQFISILDKRDIGIITGIFSVLTFVYLIPYVLMILLEGGIIGHYDFSASTPLSYLKMETNHLGISLLMMIPLYGVWTSILIFKDRLSRGKGLIVDSHSKPKTQITNLINGARWVIRDLTNPKYEGFSKSKISFIPSTDKEREETARQVFKENPDKLDIEIMGDRITLLKKISYSGKNEEYREYITPQQFLRFLKLRKPPYDCICRFALIVNHDMTVSINKWTKETEDSHWQFRGYSYIDESFIKIL
jgi:hypothetical protein